MEKILIVEDDKVLNEGLSFALRKENYKIISTYNGVEALNHLQHSIQLIILDINLPDIDGFTLARRIGAFYKIPIMFLTAKNEEIDILKGYENGCEDYITKPFSLPILLQKIKVILKRERANDSKYIVDNLILDFNENSFLKEGDSILLTKTEVRLLQYFVSNKGQVLTKEQLIDELWDDELEFVDTNTLSVNIRRLRLKIEDNPSKPLRIKTVFGIGYKWSEE